MYHFNFPAESTREEWHSAGSIPGILFFPRDARNMGDFAGGGGRNMGAILNEFYMVIFTSKFILVSISVNFICSGTIMYFTLTSVLSYFKGFKLALFNV